MGKSPPLCLRHGRSHFRAAAAEMEMTLVHTVGSSVTLVESRPLRTRKARGFSLLEMSIVLCMILIASGISFITPPATFKAARVDGAYNQTMTSLRRARQSAVDERKTYIVNFVVPRTLQISRQDGALPPNPAPPPVLTHTLTLPQDISFNNEAGIPTTSVGTPDGFGIGAFAIDLSVDYGGGNTSIYFRPDGGAYDQLGRINNGVIYLDRPGELTSS